MRYAHAMVRVTDLEDSLKFFCDALGLTELRRKEYPEGRFTLVFLSANQDVEDAEAIMAPLIEVTYNWDSEGYMEGRNFGHLAFRVSNIYETCERLMDKGVIINRPPRDGYMAFIRSPDNISIELLQEGSPLPKDARWMDMPTIGTW